MDKRERFFKVMEIVKRADDMGIMMFDRTSLKMDLENVDTEFNLRLDDLLTSDDSNFQHDIIGIQNNINRETKKLENMFVPRYAGNN